MPDALDRLNRALANRYRVERELGRGGMATVYLAHDVRHDREVAIKVLHEDLGATLGPERFLAEIKTTAKLQHPHVLPLLDSGSTAAEGQMGGLLYYVMPFVDGESLRDRLNREKQLPIDDAVRIAREVAGALGFAHGYGIVHRDIKPENILLQGDHALVADFGIALAVQSAGGARMTQTGLSLGTPQYMAPEQATGEKQIDLRADIYSLGAVTYEMLVGEPPFTGATVQAIVAKVLSSDPEPPTTMRKTIPAHVEAAVLMALAKLPADRFASAAAFAGALITGLPGVAASSAFRAGGRRRALQLWGAVFGLLVLGWAVGRFGGPGHTTSAPPPAMRFDVAADLARNEMGRLIAVAPAGDKFVFLQNIGRGGLARLALQRLDKVNAEILPGTDNIHNPFFSPDGEWIAFELDGRLRKMKLDGGSTVTIADVGQNYFALEGAWGRDGTILLTTRAGGVLRVPESGGTPLPVPLPKTFHYSTPVWLDGGTRFVLTRSHSSMGTDREMAVYALPDGRLIGTLGRGFAVEYVESGYLSFVTPEGALVAAPLNARSARFTGAPEVVATRMSFQGRSLSAAVARNGTLVYAALQWSDKELVLVGSAGETTTLPLGSRAFRGPRFAPDGRRIAVDVEAGGDLVGDIYLFDRGPGTFTRVTREGSSVFPEWTADGKSLLYSALAVNGRSIFRLPVDRSAPPALVVQASFPALEAVTTVRGDTILYRVNSDSSGRDIFLAAGGKNAPWEAGPFNERSPAISPDGRLTLYVSDESGRDGVYVRPLATPGSVQVSVADGAEPRWGPDGREAYYWANDTLFAVPIVRTPTLAVGTRRLVLTGVFARDALHANYDVAPDGRSFVMIRPTQSTSLAMVQVLLNWIPMRRPPK